MTRYYTKLSSQIPLIFMFVLQTATVLGIVIKTSTKSGNKITVTAIKKILQ